MKVVCWQDVAGQEMGAPAPGVTKRVLIGPKDGAPNFAMRHFTIEPGKNTPYHEHDWEHEVFVLEGQGVLVTGEGERILEPGEAVYVPLGKTHQFRNVGKQALRFLCVVPLAGEK